MKYSKAVSCVIFLSALLFGLCVAQTTPEELLHSQRMIALQTWVERSSSPFTTYIAYSLFSDLENVTHTVRGVGSFGPGVDRAAEYDNILFVPDPNTNRTPIVLRPIFDPYTLQWLEEDKVQVNYVLNASTLFNVTTQAYDINEDGMRYTDYFVFNPNTSRVRLDYTKEDPIGARIFQVNTDAINSTTLCQLTFFACGRTPENFAATGFTSFEDCIQLMESLKSQKSKCPHAFLSNTTNCRALHATSAIQDPDVHCSHVRRDSVVCRDQCLPQCSNCAADAKCVSVYPDIFTTQYECQCNEGFTGDGHTCTRNQCSTAQDCNDNPNQVDCVEGACKCRSSFTWNSSIAASQAADVCQCHDGRVFSDGPNGPVCIPTGRCLRDNHCQVQNPETVKCVRYGKETPFSSPFKSCLCNYGYKGGWEYPCICPAPRREVNSRALGGKVCLGPHQCTENRHCTQPRASCHIPSGDAVGSCLID